MFSVLFDCFDNGCAPVRGVFGTVALVEGDVRVDNTRLVERIPVLVMNLSGNVIRRHVFFGLFLGWYIEYFDALVERRGENEFGHGSGSLTVFGEHEEDYVGTADCFHFGLYNRLGVETLLVIVERTGVFDVSEVFDVVVLFDERLADDSVTEVAADKFGGHFAVLERKRATHVNSVLNAFHGRILTS